MTSPYRKKLIEVSLPLAAINAESAREKSIRHGHPSTLHLWWARRPLAACRAVLFASLVDDPDSDPQYRKADGTVDEERAGIKRADLFNLIEELVAWENSNNADVIRSARAEIARCVASRKIELKELDPKLELAPQVTVSDLVTRGHCRPKAMGLDKKAGRVRFAFDVSHLPPSKVVNTFLAEHVPPLLDPFAGGGSIPLEAQRLGLRTYASDLNPVPVLINKALIEIPPKFAGRPPVNPESRGHGTGKAKGKQSLVERDWPGATGLADDVRYYGKWMRDEAEKRIGHLYPPVEITAEMAKGRPELKEYVGQKLTVIAWIWARTVASSNPAANGAMTPLMSTFWLCRRKGHEAWVEPRIDNESRKIVFHVKSGTPLDAAALSKGTVKRSGATCLFTKSPISFEYIRDEGKANRIGQQLIAIVAETKNRRLYLPATEDHIAVANCPRPENIPDTDLPEQALSIRVMLYGMDKHWKLFTNRQLTLLAALCKLAADARIKLVEDVPSCDKEYARAIATYLAEAVSKTVAFHCTLASWRAKEGKSARAFGRQSMPMVWDFAEVNPLAPAGGSLDELFDAATKTIAALPANGMGEAYQHDAAAPHPKSEVVISTDPPYYDNVNYADLSDFYYAWLRLSLLDVYPELFSTVLTPKSNELIASPFRHGGSREKAQRFFEKGLGSAFQGMLAACNPEFPTTVYYAFKQQESDDDVEAEEDESASSVSTGWETMLSGLIGSGFCIVGTWPMRTESVVGLKNLSSVLASSIVLVCRRRPKNAPIATRKDFFATLRRELPEALRNLQHGNIAPVDLAQSAIGPGMAVFTRYANVLESDGSSMTVRTALGLINQTLDEVLAEQEGEFDGDTRWALSWFEQFGTKEEAFGVAETLSKAKNTAVNGLVEAGVIAVRSGKVRLLKRDELTEDWDPETDRRLTVWESVQHLIRVLEMQGEAAAGDLVKKLGTQAETCRDLAYRLYSVCERKKWAEEALAYNGLVIAWPELVRLSLASDTRPRETQAQLFS